MFKVKNYLLPNCVQRLFELRENQHHFRDTGTGIFKKIRARTKNKNSCMSVEGANLWNSLEKEFRMCTSIHIFKKCLNTRS